MPHWFTGFDSISKLLGLELIESLLINYSRLFIKVHMLKRTFVVDPHVEVVANPDFALCRRKSFCIC